MSPIQSFIVLLMVLLCTCRGVHCSLWLKDAMSWMDDSSYDNGERTNSTQHGPNTLGIKTLKYLLNFAPYEQNFERFKQLFNKTYTTESERLQRLQQFKSNLLMMEKHNWMYLQGKTSYYMAPNQFSDMSYEEYLKYNKLNTNALGNSHRTKRSTSILPCYGHMNRFDAPSNIDWRQKDAVTSVKDQGHCGSCWTFSANGAIEGQHYLKTGTLISLSEQQVLDCCDLDYCNGCDGGDPTLVYEYANDAGGLTSENTYPYEDKVQDSCQFTQSTAAVTVTRCWIIDQSNEADLQNAVGTKGPVSVAVNAYHSTFMNYAGGIYYDESCKSDEKSLDHGMLVVGYGSSNGNDYWIVKNSWGESWGQDGYIYMSRNRDNNCGIATYPSYPGTAIP